MVINVYTADPKGVYFYHKGPVFVVGILFSEFGTCFPTWDTWVRRGAL